MMKKIWWKRLLSGFNGYANDNYILKGCENMKRIANTIFKYGLVTGFAVSGLFSKFKK